MNIRIYGKTSNNALILIRLTFNMIEKIVMRDFTVIIKIYVDIIYKLYLSDVTGDGSGLFHQPAASAETRLSNGAVYISPKYSLFEQPLLLFFSKFDVLL